MQNKGLCINPSINLVSNIDFGENPTHTSNRSEFASLPIQTMQFPLKHPTKIEVDINADKYTHKYAFGINKYINQKIKWFLKSKFTKPYMIIKKYFYKVFFNKKIYDDTYLMSFFK